MYVCEDCGREFDEPVSWKESRGECHGFPAYETMYGCSCGSTNYSPFEDEYEDEYDEVEEDFE